MHTLDLHLQKLLSDMINVPVRSDVCLRQCNQKVFCYGVGMKILVPDLIEMGWGREQCQKLSCMLVHYVKVGGGVGEEIMLVLEKRTLAEGGHLQ